MKPNQEDVMERVAILSAIIGTVRDINPFDRAAMDTLSEALNELRQLRELNSLLPEFDEAE